jgi:hypothetical protein
MLVVPMFLLSTDCFWSLKIRDFLENWFGPDCWNSQGKFEFQSLKACGSPSLWGTVSEAFQFTYPLNNTVFWIVVSYVEYPCTRLHGFTPMKSVTLPYHLLANLKTNHVVLKLTYDLFNGNLIYIWDWALSQEVKNILIFSKIHLFYVQKKCLRDICQGCSRTLCHVSNNVCFADRVS